MPVHKRKSISRLHFITQTQSRIPLARAVLEALEAGVTWIQLRDKDKSFEELIEDAREVKMLCDQFGAVLIINDSAEVAQAVGAHGVHLGKSDMHPYRARELLGDIIIGGTANTLDDAANLIEAGVDYIGLGPFRFTQTKANLSPVLEIAGVLPVAEFCQRENMPVIVVGGVTAADVSELRQIGVHGVAVSQAVYGAATIREGTQQFLMALGESSGIFSDSR